jgi:membrane protein implicated in regulation of membrane protease activity
MPAGRSFLKEGAVLTVAYVALAVLGCAYVLVSAFLGHGSDAAHDGGHASDSHSDYGVDGSGHGTTHASAGGGDAFHFPFFSPLALSTLAAAIGAWGLIGQFGFHLAGDRSLLLAVPAALLTAYVVTWASWRMVSGSRGTSAIRLSALAGSPAEVTTPIPAGGVGEVAALVDGQRFTAPAREADGGAVARGAAVTVVRMVGNTLLVTPQRGAGRESTHA